MSKSTKSTPNRLINETSPYLLQHAYNPVDWYAWNEEALNKARSEDKPILVSIGYSACHWCHVMERESFENEDIAKTMNKKFICIKVDREERPDLDKVYQLAHQMFNKRGGGWPLTVMLTPDEHIPIHVGTYYPDKSRGGMPGFPSVLEGIANLYREKDKFISKHSNAVKAAYNAIKFGTNDSAVVDSEQLLRQGVEGLANEYDQVYGGFGVAPKFPNPTQFSLLMAYFTRTKNAHQPLQQRSLNMVAHTLESMAAGGIYDQLGGGFCRYSVDAKWEIPHFEKMLYDTAQLMPIYVDAGSLSSREDFHTTAIDCGEWVLREMQSQQGGYYSAIDADSEGEEGKFYVWTLEQLQTLLDPEELTVAVKRFGLRGVPNFEGKWHLRVSNSLTTVASDSGFSENQVKTLLDSVHEKLLTERNQRVAPLCDDKILASWNGLMIKAMARTGHLLERQDFVESAQNALNYVRQHLWMENRLLATARGDKAHLNAYLDDYVFVADAVLELLQARWSDDDFEFAKDLMDVVLKHFEDPDCGALCFTSDDHEHLLYRAVPSHDEAIPSGNGVAAQVLLKLGFLTHNPQYDQAAKQIVDALMPALTRMPSACGSTLVALEHISNPGPTLILIGEADDTRHWAKACRDHTDSQITLYSIPPDAKNPPKSIANLPVHKTQPVAYLCQGFTCSAPATNLDQLLRLLS